MPTFDALLQRILTTKNFWRKVLIGGALSCIPLVHFLALGYLYRYAQRLRSTGNLTLPEWAQWDQLLWDGLKCFAVMLPFVLVPTLLLGGISLLVSVLFSVVGLDLFAWTVALVPFAISIFISVPLALVALWFFQEEERWDSLLKLDQMILLLRENLAYLLVPYFSVMGLFFIGWPLFGFAFFLGMLLLMAYHTALFSNPTK
ncbi:MAG: DUF4013 domain-containing protein [Opitutales bacterium]|nr:DUF4013 domain-containing protein [Opitutales bacterium]